MTTRPGFIWSGTEWIAIGQEAVLAPVKYQATAPSSPATGDIWIESDVDVPSIDSAQFLRWRKTMAGGETSLSGNDDLSLPLRYTPGYEQLYINGVLQVRGGDYTATTGTTVTGLTALVANDVVEIFSAVARTVADVYTQTQSDTKYSLKTVADKIDTSQTVTSTSYVDMATVGPTVTLTTGTSVLVNVGAFLIANAANNAYMGFTVSGASTLAASDNNSLQWSNASVTTNFALRATRQVLVTGLTPGVNTFTSKYRVTGGTGTIADRTISVQPIG